MPKPYFYDDRFMWDCLKVRQLPEMLHQYTSISSLKKILESKTIKHSRLDSVNDPEEATASDLEEAASTVFVSCWTASDRESIPMWSMYGDRFKGVRLSLPSNMFLGRNKPKVFDKGGASTIVGLSDSDRWKIERESPASRSYGRGLIGPNKVFYSNEPRFRNREILHKEGGTVCCYTHDLGMVKSEHWAYEEEWRFKLSWFFGEMSFPDDEYLEEIALNFKDYPILNKEVFVPLDPTSLKEAQIITGPLMPEADRNELREFVESLELSTVIKESEIPLRENPGK